MTTFFKRERESKGGKKVPRKKDVVVPFTFVNDFEDPAPTEETDQSDPGTDSAPENEELEMPTEIKIQHDHRYTSTLAYTTLMDLPDEARYIFEPIPEYIPIIHQKVSLLDGSDLLCDGIIDDSIKLLVHLLRAEDSILIFYTCNYQQLTKKRRLKVNNPSLRFIKDSEALNRDMILCPINVDNSHWILGVIVWSTTTIYIFDSLTRNCTESFMNLFELVKYSYAVAQLELDFTKWKFRYASDAMKQSNSYDCGVFVCLHAASFILEQKIPYDSSEDARRWIKWVLSRNFPIKERKIKRSPVRLETMKLLKPCMNFSICSSSQVVYNEIISSITHEKKLDLCSAHLCSKLTGSAVMDMCVVCRKWFHQACHGILVATYFICSNCHRYKI